MHRISTGMSEISAPRDENMVLTIPTWYTYVASFVFVIHKNIFKNCSAQKHFTFHLPDSSLFFLSKARAVQQIVREAILVHIYCLVRIV